MKPATAFDAATATDAQRNTSVAWPRDRVAMPQHGTPVSRCIPTGR